MSSKPKQPNAYFRTKVLTANPLELRLMLFDGAIRFATQAREGIAEKDYEKSFEGVTRCQDTILELINSLRPEHDPELCQNLAALYTFMYTHMVDASRERNAEKVDEVIELLRYERETWVMLMDQLAGENTDAATGEASAVPVAPKSPAPTPAASSKANGLVGGRVSLQG